MTPFFMLVGAIGLADIVATAIGADKRSRIVGAAIAAGAFSAYASSASGYDWAVGFDIVVGTIVALLAAGWLVAQQHAEGADDKAAQSSVLLLVTAVITVVVVATSGLWPSQSADQIATWIADLPYGAGSTSANRTMAMTAAVLFLVESANVVVRLTLNAVSVKSGTPQSPERSIKGGRVIGPIERILIFGLAVSGEPTAAALIISAKGLLRYPELNAVQSSPSGGADNGDEDSEGGPSPSELSEYLVVGSMVSWALALFLVVWLPA